MKKFSLLFTFAAITVLSNASFGQIFYPGGETCEEAIPITPAEGFHTVDDDVLDTYWYTFIAPCDGTLTVSDGGPNEATKRIHSGVCGSLTTVAEGTWATSEISYEMTSGEEVYIEINDSWDLFAQYNISYTDCAEVDSILLDIEGHVYYDLNDNGVKDFGEPGKFLTPIFSEPAGIFSVSLADGYYYGPVSDLPDDTYEISPTIDEYWSISSDSLFYTIVVDPDFEQRDSLDFGIYPDSLFYEIETDLIAMSRRCNDTVNYIINVRNTGTRVIDSGFVHLELDDSLYYVNADVAPDSIVGQNLYWTYGELFFYESTSINLEIGTPDGVADTVYSVLDVNVDSAGVEVYEVLAEVDEEISCAYDPNDKTPTPLGDGEFGNIPPTTESIEYLIRFQNTGTDTAINVVITDQLDENLEWYTITPLVWSHDMTYDLTPEGEVSFIFDNIMLPDTNVDMAGSQGFVKYRIELKEGLPLGTSIYNTANIYFDLNPAIVTNTTVNTLFLDESGIEDWVQQESIMVYPNPFSETTTVYVENDLKDYEIRIVDLLGKEVYANDNLNGNQVQINPQWLNSGMYVLLLVEKGSDEIVGNVKLLVE